MKKIAALIVLYNPQLDVLYKNINVLINDCDVILVNNGEKLNANFLHSQIHSIDLGENKGIAFALNYGLNYCIKKEYDYIITLDQDSEIEKDLIVRLLDSYLQLLAIDSKMAVISPIHINIDSQLPYKVKKLNTIERYIEVRELLTSGMFMHTSIFKEVGLMDSKLFIDGVDSEWCWRAAYKANKHFYMDTRIKMFHKLGEGDKNFFGRRIAIATPFRCYFQYRNYFILSTYKYTPFSWIVKNGIKYFIRFFYYPLFIRPRLSYLGKTIHGICDGFKYLIFKKLY